MEAKRRELQARVESLKGLTCWYVSCGGCVGASFELALGKKVLRESPLKNSAHSIEFRNFKGEANLLVWCSWRLDGPDAPLTSSDDSQESLVRELQQLVGASVESVTLTKPAWDLALGFSNGLQLRVFCDHVPGDPSFDGNWDLSRQDVGVYVGPGTRLRIEVRTDEALPLSGPEGQPVSGRSSDSP